MPHKSSQLHEHSFKVCKKMGYSLALYLKGLEVLGPDSPKVQIITLIWPKFGVFQ